MKVQDEKPGQERALSAPKPFLGFAYKIINDLPETGFTLKATSGVKATHVIYKSPSYKAGLCDDDIIFQFDEAFFDSKVQPVYEHFRELMNAHSPGDRVNIKVLRMESSSSAEVNGKKVSWEFVPEDYEGLVEDLETAGTIEAFSQKRWLVKELTVKLGKRKEEDVFEPLPEIEQTDLGRFISSIQREGSIPWKQHVDKAVEKYRLKEPYNDLRKRLKEIEDESDGHRLQAIAAVHRDPFIYEKMGREFTDRLLNTESNNQGSLFSETGITQVLTGDRINIKPVAFSTLSMDSDPEQFKKWFENQLSLLSSYLDKAYASFSKKEKRFLLKHRLKLMNTFGDFTYIESGADKESFVIIRKIISLGREIDQVRLIEAVKYTFDFIQETEDQVFAWMAAHPNTILMETTWGTIGFGSSGPDRWDNLELKFIYDPGGDDIYVCGAGTAKSFDQPFSWIIDIKGDDRYMSTSNGAQGCGRPGIGILVDRKGNDSYTAKREAQGSGFFGAGILIDESGDDTFRASEFSQGSGMFGIGILKESKGNDRYDATILSQGVGFPKGIGILIEQQGNDKVYCSGKKPSSYKTNGLFEGWSQGCGKGFRGLASGGIGVVADGSGRDTYEAGNFSQGGGYYFGMGIFRAAGNENDSYLGSRYAQGFSAHQAAGLFIEDGGSDSYFTNIGVMAGVAWDQSLSVFVDEKGDDIYNGGTFFSLGSSAHNGMALFLDRAGTDSYLFEDSPGKAGPNDYHGGSSFSFFIDKGPEKDIYNGKKEKNNVEIHRPEHGIFRDGDPR